MQMLMSIRRECAGVEESEPVMVAVRGPVLVLTLDDGQEIEMDRCELMAAAEAEAKAA